MNIALFTEMEPVDGQGRFVLLHARWLKAHGHEPILFCPESPLLEELKGLEIPHISINSVRQAIPIQYEMLVEEAAHLARACSEFAVEAMIATANLPFTMAKAALGDSIPIFLPILSNTYFLNNTPFNITQVQQTAALGRIWGNAYASVAAHAKAFGFDPMLARYAPIPIDGATREPEHERMHVRESLGIGIDELLVLTVSRLDVDKAPGIPPLATAIEAMRSEGIAIRLAVVGEGTYLETLRLQCPASVIFLGTRRDLADLYHACDIYCGEGMTVLEAAMARRPVILTGASFHRDTPDRVFAVYGLHLVDFAFTDWNNFSPPTTYTEALRPLVEDATLRERVAQAAFDTVMARNHQDRVLPWLVDVLAGKPVASIQFGEYAKAIIAVPGGVDDGIDAVGKICAKIGDREKIAVRFDEPVPFGRVYAMPIPHAQALARATRRWTSKSLPTAYYTHGKLSNQMAIPDSIRDAFSEIEGKLPPTSTEPRLAFTPARREIHGVVAKTIENAVALLATLPPTDDCDAIVVWIPIDLDPQRFSHASALLGKEATPIALFIAQRLAWTVVGRLLVALTTYRDDASPEFELYRCLASELGADVSSEGVVKTT